MSNRLIIVSLCVLAVTAFTACDLGLLADDDFRSAIPDQEDLKVRLGMNDAQADQVQSAEYDPYADCDECCRDTAAEEYIIGDIYELTREAMWNVNGSLLVTMGWVEAIVNAPYAEELENGYVWGPWTEDLSRITFRFVMTEEGNGYQFQLEGKNINDSSDNWQPVVIGDVTPGDEPHRGFGNVSLDFDTIHAIDASHPSTEHGKVTYDFDVREYPYDITVTFEGFGEGEETFDAVYTYTKEEDLGGHFTFTANMDVTGPGEEPDGINEEFAVESRWLSSGEGWGEANVTGGSLDDEVVSSFTLTECWADSAGLYYETYDRKSVAFLDGTAPIDEVGCGVVENCPVF